MASIIITGKSRPACVGFLAMLLLVVTVLPLKSVVQRPRPRDILESSSKVEARLAAKSWSFPSGDTATVFAAAAAVAPEVDMAILVLFFVAGSACAFLRVYCYAHYPSDICAGAAIGIITGILAIRLAPILLPKINISRQLAWIGIIVAPLIGTMTTGSRRWEELLAFLVFYPPIAGIGYMLWIRHKTKSQLCLD